MENKIGLAVISEMFGLSYTEIAQRIGASKQEVSMWSNGKRSIPKKWLEKLAQIEEFKVIPEILTRDNENNFFQKEMDKLEINSVKIMHLEYLAERDGVNIEDDTSHPYSQKMLALLKEEDKLGELENVERMLDRDDYTNYLEILKRVNFVYSVQDFGRLEALIAILKLTAEDGFFIDIQKENEFVQELYRLLNDYGLLDGNELVDQIKAIYKNK